VRPFALNESVLSSASRSSCVALFRSSSLSALQSRIADDSGHYAFTKRGRGQAVDGGEQGTMSVLTTVFAYGPNGHLQWKSGGQVSTYHYVLDGVETGTGSDPCRIYVATV
jgi:hypothetical protein